MYDFLSSEGIYLLAIHCGDSRALKHRSGFPDSIMDIGSHTQVLPGREDMWAVQGPEDSGAGVICQSGIYREDSS